MDRKLAVLERKFIKNPSDIAIQREYCVTYARAGQKKPEDRCQVPWCKKRVGRRWLTKTFCTKHNTHQIREWMNMPKPVEFRLANKNWYYSGAVDIDYEEHRDCYERGCDSICRCSVITDAHAKSQDISVVVDEAINDNAFSEITQYCIDRVIRRTMSDHPSENWEVNTCGGYYGDEIDNVRLDCAQSIEEEIRKLLSKKTDKERLLFALEMEYGLILDIFNDYNHWSIETVSIDAVSGNDGHLKRLNPKTVKSYDGYKFPRCILLKRDDESGKYRIMDGYHRFSNAKRNGKSEVLAIVGHK